MSLLRRGLSRIILVTFVAAAMTGCVAKNSADLAIAFCQNPENHTSGTISCASNATSEPLDISPVGSIPPARELESRTRNNPIDASSDQQLPEGAASQQSGRAAVPQQLADTSADLVSTIAPKGMPQAAAAKSRAMTPAGHERVPELSLADAVAVAVLSHPLMGAQAAKIKGAIADRHYAEGASRPALEVYGGSGQGSSGMYSNMSRLFGQGNVPSQERTDVGFTFKQLIFDFGAARSEVARNNALIDAERLRLADQAEDIALRTVNAYLNLLEQSELTTMIDNTVAQQRKLADLVKLSQQNGNGTKADVDRIQSKVIETEAMRSDINTAYHVALDEFHRLTGLEPKQVKRPKSLNSNIPKTAEKAIDEAQIANPSLLALRSTAVAFDHQLDEVKSQNRPRLDLQSDALVKHYTLGDHAGRQGIVDARAMLMLSYKLMDGGMLSAQAEHVLASRQANDFRMLDEHETIELNLRRFYQALTANRAKRDAAARGLSTAKSVNELYIEQFQAGKRTIFELLDANMMIFTMQKNRINGEYEEMRSIYGVLRNIGRLGETIAKS